MRGFIEAYERLVWARNNPPSPEALAKIERDRRESDYRAKVNRLRRSVA